MHMLMQESGIRAVHDAPEFKRMNGLHNCASCVAFFKFTLQVKYNSAHI